MPNAKNEIHVDGNFTKTIVWNEYKDQMVESQLDYLSHSAFSALWKDTMPYVKIRKFKNVDSKCRVCANICLLRSKAKTREERLELTQLFFWHKMMFMSERSKYYDRRHQAIVSYLSLYLFPSFFLMHCLSFSFHCLYVCS